MSNFSEKRGFKRREVLFLQVLKATSICVKFMQKSWKLPIHNFIFMKVKYTKIPWDLENIINVEENKHGCWSSLRIASFTCILRYPLLALHERNARKFFLEVYLGLSHKVRWSSLWQTLTTTYRLLLSQRAPS